MEKSIAAIYKSLEFVGVSMVFLGICLMRHNMQPMSYFIIYGLGCVITIMCPVLYFFDKIDAEEEKKGDL